MHIKQVLESCLYVDDLAAARVFYAQVLGLEVHSQAPGRHLFFRCGHGMFLLFNPDATSESTGNIPTHGAYGPGHIAFAVQKADLPAWREHLLQHNVAIEAEITWPTGGYSIYFRDPAGNSVELATPQTWEIEKLA
jgi:catechol 2,3-dioxygenase-like lactoylglutathione lyase family enzyme